MKKHPEIFESIINVKSDNDSDKNDINDVKAIAFPSDPLEPIAVREKNIFVFILWNDGNPKFKVILKCSLCGCIHSLLFDVIQCSYPIKLESIVLAVLSNKCHSCQSTLLIDYYKRVLFKTNYNDVCFIFYRNKSKVLIKQSRTELCSWTLENGISADNDISALKLLPEIEKHYKDWQESFMPFFSLMSKDLYKTAPKLISNYFECELFIDTNNTYNESENEIDEIKNIAFDFAITPNTELSKAILISIFWNDEKPQYHVLLKCKKCGRVHSFFINNIPYSYPIKLTYAVSTVLSLYCEACYTIFSINDFDIIIFRTNYKGIEFTFNIKDSNAAIKCFGNEVCNLSNNYKKTTNKHNYILDDFPEIKDHYEDWKESFLPFIPIQNERIYDPTCRFRTIKAPTDIIIYPNIKYKYINGKITLKWDKIKNASKYIIYIKHNDNVVTYTSKKEEYSLYISKRDSIYGFAIVPFGSSFKIYKNNDIPNKYYYFIRTPKKHFENPYSQKVNILKVIEKKKESEDFYEFKPVDIIILSTTRFCASSGHETENITAWLPVKVYFWTERISVDVGYCKQCKKYIMLESIYEKIKDYGLPLCTIMDSNYRIISTCPQNIFDNFNVESTMHKMGYNVSTKDNLSSEERKAILVKMIDENIASKNDVISHLEGLIKLNGSRPNMSSARLKWEDDVEYIRNYKPKNTRNVTVNSITKK